MQMDCYETDARTAVEETRSSLSATVSFRPTLEEIQLPTCLELVLASVSPAAFSPSHASRLKHWCLKLVADIAQEQDKLVREVMRFMMFRQVQF